MSKTGRNARRASRPQVPPRRSANQRRARQARSRRRRRIAWATAGTVLAGVVALVAVVAIGHNGATSANKAVSVGAAAPDGTFTSVAGDTETVASLGGRPALLWFVATWCSSCQAGTEAVAQKIDDFAAHGVRVVELEMADDLGQPGPSISAFGQRLAGAAYTNPGWTFGVASSELTTTYNPRGYLDIYYLIDSAGRITYANSAPASTMGQLLAAVSNLGNSSPAPIGPQAVAVPQAQPLAGAATAVSGKPVDGISCEPTNKAPSTCTRT